MAPQYKLTYFDFKGLAEPIRYILSYVRADWEDDRITSYPPYLAGDRDPSQWNDLKPKTPWGTVPILEEGGKQLSQNNAIIRYLGNKYGLGGSNEWENVKLDEYFEAFSDVQKEASKAIREMDEVKKAEITKNNAEVVIPMAWKRFNEILKKNGSGYLVGKKLTYVDIFVAYFVEVLPKVMGLGDKYGTEYAHLQALVNKVNEEPGIKEWIQNRPATPF